MKKLKIGIMPREEFQRRTFEIAAGRIKPKRSEPKIWFSSMKALSGVLTETNVRLLKLVNQHQPESLKQLAELSGCKLGTLSRTLKTLEKYGIVELRKHDNRKIRPIAKVTEFEIRYTIA